MHSDGPGESLLERCADRIEREAEPKQRTDMLMISQVMAELQYPQLDLLSIFGGHKMIVESPLLQKLFAERIHSMILTILKDRFKTVPRDVTKILHKIVDEKKLTSLIVLAGKCRDINSFRDALAA